jgi:ribosomal protein L7/L12
MQPELDRLIRANQKINAIKHYRMLTGDGLKESKDAVEARMAELGLA